MNKIDFAKINKKEDMIMAFNQLKDDYSIAFQQITQLTNNWNELEEWLKEDKLNVYCCSKSSQKAFEGAKAMYKIIILNKMKEIKERKNENIKK